MFVRPDLMKLLLADKRINPADDNSGVIQDFTIFDGTIENGMMKRYDMLKLLLEDGRADPSVNNNQLYSAVKRFKNFPPKLLLEKDDRVIGIEFLNGETKPLTTTTFLNLFNSPLKWGTSSYIQSVFSERPNDLVANFLSDLLKIHIAEAKNIHNLDDFDIYIFEMHKEILNGEYNFLLAKKTEFLWRYYGATLGYNDHSSRFQELTVSMASNRVLPEKR